ncbi:MAG: phosphoglucosamine mutase [Bacteroidales bacterium]|jgi:phosphomannomutase|nr:phosphoglucosamine mutase [Bacteroidales bacterium]
MTLIKSISGIRGTIGGRQGEGLTPSDIVRFTAAYGVWVRQEASAGGHQGRIRVVIGRDARISGEMVRQIVTGTLIGMGIDVTDTGLAATPTVEMAVTAEKAQGGLILTASHNPKQWNALKLLNSAGEFLSDREGQKVLATAENESFSFADADALGKVTEKDYTQYHIDRVAALPLTDVDAIRARKFKVTVDGVNSVGGIVIPRLLKTLGVAETVELNCTPDGNFPHNPEPLPEHLAEIAAVTRQQSADVGFVVDPDVDRLAIVNEDGSMFGEEYTLVAVADYVLDAVKGNTVSNLSSSRALRDVTRMKGGQYFATAVGEVNVVEGMKARHAVIGGEGNGGIIYPDLHYGRDALVGIALFLTHLAKSGLSCSRLRAQYPSYFMSKNKIALDAGMDPEAVLRQLKRQYAGEQVNDADGIKIDFAEEWAHLRKSNTEPVIRIYTESRTQEGADALAQKIIRKIQENLHLVM